eukprot:TRINITY_DN6647_c0_g1_i5.p1 TRINITY_DN6647_c0_g1~~TRINITY_DN6647_c0_g1_i5.p1  ORF type:complete len:553 (+),score=60.37 TRINITY_DN6647_c0_g1_i5:68-1726(+)
MKRTRISLSYLLLVLVITLLQSTKCKTQSRKPSELFTFLQKRQSHRTPLQNQFQRFEYNQTVKTYKPCGNTERSKVLRNRGVASFSRALTIPQCGSTICDNPDLTVAYGNMMTPGRFDVRRARLRILTIANDAGQLLPINDDMTQTQMTQFNADFLSLGIQFTHTLEYINSTFLRFGKITPYACPIERLGNGRKDGDCLFPNNGYDGGDYVCSNAANCNAACTFENIMSGNPSAYYCTCICVRYNRCTNDMLGDGVCQEVCNQAAKNYDNGDCCLDPTAGTCRDHRRPMLQRNFADVTEIRTFFNVQHGKELAVVVGPMTDEGLAGIATFPWEATFDKPTFGGFTVGDEFWGDTPLYKLYSSVAGHEAGHCLGLYHVHNGVTEVSGCNDPCFEPQPADGQTGTMLKGDMFSDTRPTPINFYCYDPPRCTSSTSLNCQDCKGNRWVNTPFTNVMSYSDQPAECRVKVFSPQQLGRMRCYYDMYFSDWDNNGEPGVIPLAPSIVRRSNSFALSWEPPINRGTSTPLGYVIERQSSSEVRNFTTNTASFEDFDIR